MGYLILSLCLITFRWGNSFAEQGPFTNEPALWSLRCLYAGEERCTSALTDYVLPDSNNITFQELEELFMNMNTDLQKAFTDRDLERLSSELVCHIPKPLLLLLSEDNLAVMHGDVLGKLLECNEDDLAVVRLIGSSVEKLKDPYSFYTTIQSKNLKENTVSILGSGIKSMSSINSAQWLVSGHNSVLEYLSPDIILDDKYSLFQWMKNIEGWDRRPQRVKRIWAYALKRHILPQRFSDWDDSTLQSMGHFLGGSTVQELEELEPERILNKTGFFQSPFSVVQIRGLFDNFKRYQVLGSSDYAVFKGVIHRLLPKHLQQFLDDSLDLKELSHLKEPTSIATSRQIVEYIVHYSKNSTTIQELVSTKDGLMALNQLLYVLPLSVFHQLNYTLPFKELLPLQHHKLSLGQADCYIDNNKFDMTPSKLYALTGGGGTYQLTLTGIDGAYDILRGLPTALLSGGVPDTVYFYLMSKLPSSAPPRTAALLDHLIFKSGSDKNYRSVFKNKDAKNFLNFLPSKYIERHYGTLLSALDHYIDLNPKFASEIPEHVLSILLTKGTNRNLTWSSFIWNNDSRIYPVLLRGLTCTDVNNLSPVDFIHVISRFNSLRTTFGWGFPKNLQQCGLKKFVEYLEMKSAFMTYYLNDGLVSLMTSSDVEAVGGFLLAGLPLKELRVAPELDLVIKTIGQLSIPELLVACSMEKLVDIGNLYYQPNMGKDLFNLGNLTAFLAAPNIETIVPADLKLMIESGLMDRRVCIPDSQRDSWSSLILQAFGSADKWEAQDLVTLGDLLLVIPHHDLSQVDPRVWAEAADILANSGYFEVIHLTDKPMVYYELCEEKMQDSYEATTFRKELFEYAGWLLTAAQHQMNSVVNASSMKAGIRMNPQARPKSIEIVSESAEGDSSDGRNPIFPFSSAMSSSRQSLVEKVSCDAIRTVGKPSELYITASIINNMRQEDIDNCIEEFGKMDLPKEFALQIWNKLDTKLAPHLAGKLLSQASPTDLIGWNLSFEENWAHETIFYLANYNHNEDTISALVEVINKQKLILLTTEQVVALGPLTCRLPDARVTHDVFFKASRHLGATLPCDITCLQYFEPSFQDIDAYGPINEWSPEDVESLGILIAGLKFEDWIKLVNSDEKLLSRMGTRALECLPKQYVQALTESAVRQLPATTSFTEFMDFLNSSVKEALKDHLMPNLDFHSHPLAEFVYVWEDNRYVPHIMENSGPLNQPILISISLLPVCYYMFL